MKRLFSLLMVCTCLAMPFMARGVADETSFVASIGETLYATLEAAIDAAQSGETVKLLKDVTLTATPTFTKSGTVMLDINTHTLVSPGEIRPASNIHFASGFGVKTGGGAVTTVYPTFAEVLTVAGEASGQNARTVCVVYDAAMTLTADVVLPDGDATTFAFVVRESYELTLDLAGYAMTQICPRNRHGSPYPMFQVDSGATMTLNDSSAGKTGRLVCAISPADATVSEPVYSGMAILANGGVVTLNGGTITGDIKQNATMVQAKSGGSVTVAGATIDAGDYAWALYSMATITVNAGTIIGLTGVTTGNAMSINIPNVQYYAAGTLVKPVVGTGLSADLVSGLVVYNNAVMTSATKAWRFEDINTIPEGTVVTVVSGSEATAEEIAGVKNAVAATTKGGTLLASADSIEVFGGQLTATKAGDGTTTVLTYDYDFGVSGLEMKADGVGGALNAYVVVGLKENGRVLDDDRTLTDRTLTVTVDLWNNDQVMPKTYTVSDPVFKADAVRKASVCQVPVPWTDLDLGTNVITVKVSKAASVTP